MNDIYAKITVKGMVQMVGYRYFTHHHAIRLGLKGYVKNLYNGDVEVVVEGDRSVIEELITILKVGPRSARVTDISIKWEKYTGKYKSFNITF